MTAPRPIPPETRARQLAASDPRVSAWVSANAGSGKTTVLANRVIRLLLDGVAPSGILCLTFTKAAAANMQNRIFRILGGWAALDDAALGGTIRDLAGALPDAEGLVRARRLFAAAVETPGGLKILTIHAFCERVLHVFPFEANVPAQFTVLEERGAAELLERTRLGIILEANARPESPIGRAMARIVEEAGDEAFAALIGEIADGRDAIRDMLRDAGPAIIVQRIRSLLDLGPGESVASIDAALDDFGIPEAAWPGIAAALSEAEGKTMVELGDKLAAAHAAPAAAKAGLYRRLFTTAEGRARQPGKFLTKAFAAAHPGLAERLLAELSRIAGLIERRILAAAAERSEALLAIAQGLIDGYAAEKHGRAALDFDDLVDRTLSLLLRAGADWVLYKLDRGIDHILVDEAQDTSPKQWEIIRLLASEFTAGEGARGPGRTVFAVGDEKQSIFSFQGAAPAQFARMRSHFGQGFSAAGLGFSAVDLTHSFRSTRDVLAAVDAVFADAGNRRGLSSDDVATLHQTIRDDAAGRVEVWPLIGPAPDPAIEAWDAPFDETPNASPVAGSARRIALEVGRLLAEGDRDTGAQFRPGDVMVLVRSRNALFEAVIRALKQEGVPVAGADRIVLTDHIAVMDLVAIARFTLLPGDDLMLATVMKTPLIGLDDEDLIRLAPGRKSSLLSALREAARSDERLRRAEERLSTWIDEAAFKTPFAFFSDLLARDGGRRAFLARLGPEATDALDEFLGVSLDYERTETPSLEGFLAWLAATRADIKRDMDVARGEVRVMTVHGAKGLEARVVILADSCGAPSGHHDPRLFFVADGQAGFGRRLMLWSPGKDHDPPPVASARAAIRVEADAEHRRLLYVAMTRAEDRLVIAGHEGTRQRPEGNWYDMIGGSLRQAGARSEAMADGGGERLVLEVSPRSAAAMAEPVATSPAIAEPEWLRRPPPGGPEPASALAPSGGADDGPAASVRAPADRAASERGILVHRLLQSLPEVAPEERRARALRYLAGAAPAGLAAHGDLVDEAMAILDDPAFATVFAPGGRAEVPIIGRLARRGLPDAVVSGRIDRLCVTAEAVLVVDFKTGRGAPASPAGVAPGHVLQLALYRAVLARLYPGRAIRAALVFTATPLLIEVPAAMLDEAARQAGIA